MPTWLTQAERALLRNNSKKSKYDPIVEEVELIETNPLHSHVRLQNGRELVVSNRHLAPTGNEHSDIEDPDIEHLENDEQYAIPEQSPETSRRSSRVRHPPAYLQDYDTS